MAAVASGLGQTFGFGGTLVPLAVIGAFAAGFGLLLFTAGVAVHVIGPASDPVRAAQNYASYLTILSCLYLAFVLGVLAGGLYMVVAQILSALSSGAPIGIAEIAASLRAQGSTANSLIVAALAQQLSFLAVLYLRVIRPRVISWQGMGLDTRSLAARFRLGIIAAVAVVGAIVIAELVLNFAGIKQTQADLFEPLRRASLPQFIAFFVVGTFLAGLAEESFFRGYVFQALHREKGAIHAYLGSALIFSVAHFNVQALLPLFAGGLVLAAVFRRSASVVPGIIAHAFNNGITLAVLYFGMA